MTLAQADAILDAIDYREDMTTAELVAAAQAAVPPIDIQVPATACRVMSEAAYAEADMIDRHLAERG